MTKEHLKAYRSLKLERDTLQELIRQLDEDLRSPKTTHFGEIVSGSQSEVSPIDIKIDKKDELCALYKEQKKQLEFELWEIEQKIKGLPNRDRTLLRLYYIQGKTWEQVAEEMNYSVPHIHRLHRKALELL